MPIRKLNHALLPEQAELLQRRETTQKLSAKSLNISDRWLRHNLGLHTSYQRPPSKRRVLTSQTKLKRVQLRIAALSVISGAALKAQAKTLQVSERTLYRYVQQVKERIGL